MMHYLDINFRALLIANLPLSFFLGMCTFLAISKKVKSALGLAGYGDYVQLPYSGYGTPAQVEAGRFQDYVQLPYSGMGTPAQVEAGQFQGFGDHDETGTFAPSF